MVFISLGILTLQYIIDLGFLSLNMVEYLQQILRCCMLMYKPYYKMGFFICLNEITLIHNFITPHKTILGSLVPKDFCLLFTRFLFLQNAFVEASQRHKV